MKVAIPIFESRVSPRFDCSDTFLIVYIKSREVIKKEKIKIYDQNTIEKVNNLINMNVDTLICSGINEFNYQLILDKGIKIIPGVTGNVDEIVDLLLKNKLKPGMILFPDGRRICSRCQRQRRRFRKKNNNK